MKRLFILVALFFMVIVISNAATADEQEEKSMITALERLRAATQVGVAYQRYYELLADAKLALNVFQRSNPACSKPEVALEGYLFCKNLRSSYSSYELAGQAWKTLIESQVSKNRQGVKQCERIREESWKMAAQELDSAINRRKPATVEGMR